MEHLINKKVKNIEISGIRKFANMVAGKKGMVSLTIGQPDFPTPLHIKEAAKLPLMKTILLIHIMLETLRYGKRHPIL